MKIGFDIGGVLSKYPETFKNLIYEFLDEYSQTNIYCITDMHPIDNVFESLYQNDFIYFFKHNYDTLHINDTTKYKFSNKEGYYYGGYIRPENIYCADYEKYGNMAKAILIKELGLDIFIDDFDGYLQWDSSLGPQPILLKVIPDAYRPYWSDSWKCEGGEFGRRKYHI